MTGRERRVPEKAVPGGHASRVVEDIPVISARDTGIDGLFPAGFTDLYEVHSFRNAAHILAAACPDDFAELLRLLMNFRVSASEIAEPGGNKSRIARNMEEQLRPRGWHETRIKADLLVTRVTYVPGVPRDDARAERKFRIPNFIDGHKVDFVKNRVAFDLEWNSKDQTFDRDLYAVRTLYECNIVTAGILLTRGSDLTPVFREIHARVDPTKAKDFKGKFGASTTWMGKLLYRVDAGRAGGCPILALGIKPAMVADLEEWKAENPIRRSSNFTVDEAEPVSEG